MCVRRGSQVPRILWLGGVLPFAPVCLMLAAVSGVLVAVSPYADAKTFASCSVCLPSVDSPYKDVVCLWHDRAGGMGQMTASVDSILDSRPASDPGLRGCTRVAWRGRPIAFVGLADHPVCGWLRLCVKSVLPAVVERWGGKSDLLWAVPSLGRPDSVVPLKRIQPGGKESIRFASLAVYAAMARAPPPRSMDLR